MKTVARIGLIVLATALLASASLAAGNVLGKWRGHLTVDDRQLPPNLSAQAQNQLQDLKKLSFTITLRKEGTYVSTVSGGPLKTPKTEGGTWHQAGNKITITPAGKSGKPAQNGSQVLSVSKNGKSLAGPSTSGISMVFVR